MPTVSSSFAALTSISRATYYILRARGQGPDEARVLGRVVITREAAKRWRERITRAARKQGAKVINPDC